MQETALAVLEVKAPDFSRIEKAALDAAQQLPGYTFNQATGRYRNNATGKFVNFSQIYQLLESKYEYDSTALTRLTEAGKAGQITQAQWFGGMVQQLRRLHVQTAAFGAGGFAMLKPADFRRIDEMLRLDGERLLNFWDNLPRMGSGAIQNRINLYIGNARIHFHRTRPLPKIKPSQMIVERRVIRSGDNCQFCIYMADFGWQAVNTLPVPGEILQSWYGKACLTNCRCDLQRKVISRKQAANYIKVPFEPQAPPHKSILEMAEEIDAALATMPYKADFQVSELARVESGSDTLQVRSGGFVDALQRILQWEPADKRYDPAQPRHPKGTPTAGQWMDTDGRPNLGSFISAPEKPSKPGKHEVVVESRGKLADLHMSHYEKIPAKLKSRMIRKGVKVLINNDKSLPQMDDMGELSGVKPRGWPEGMTWDIVPGSYIQEKKFVIAGKGEHGSVSVLLHEYGHAVFRELAYQNDASFVELHRQVFDRLDPYLQQGGPGGKVGVDELFAESFAHTILDRRGSIAKFGQPVVAYMDTLLGA